jgi:hypothetical protein
VGLAAAAGAGVRGEDMASAVAGVPDLAAPFSAGSMEAAAGNERGAQWEWLLGRRAVQAGFTTLGEGWLREALARTDVPPALRRAATLDLATALIAQRRADDVERELEGLAGPRDEAWTVRRAAVDFLRDDFEALAARMEGLNVFTVAAEDAGLFHFLRATLLDRTGDTAAADAAFDEACARSPAAQAALYRLARYQRRLVPGAATEGSAAQLRAQVEQFSGGRVGFQYTLVYAAVLDRLGRKGEAIDVLQRQTRALPAAEHELRDQTLLVTGLAAGADTPEGQQAFGTLVASGSDRGLQRAALVRLAEQVPADGGAAGARLVRRLDEWLAARPAHPMTEDLLLFRAELHARNKAFQRAYDDVQSLLASFPASDLRPHALALLASVSWQWARFRTAAEAITKLRDEAPAGRERAALAVLLGECHYRAGLQARTAEDFRNAAGAYATAAGEAEALGGEPVAAGVSIGTLFYQRVSALVRAGDLDAAAALLDGPEAWRIGEDSRWQAEWNLVRFLQLKGRLDGAYRRAAAAERAANLPTGLRARFLWLATEVSLDTGRPSETLAWLERVEAFLGGPEGAGLEAALRVDLASNAILLGAQARLALREDEAGLRAMEELRARFGGTRAAAYSYVVQARHLAAASRLADAQQLLIEGEAAHRDSEYAALMLYEAALHAEARGQDANLAEASRIYQELAERYPQYLFSARLGQAGVARRLNQFALAEQIYAFLENTFPNRSDRVMVELDMAATLMAQAAADPAKFEGAISRLERLTEMPPEAAPLDLRVEAGVKLGFGWKMQGQQPEKAARVFWEVYNRFLGGPATAARLGPSGRYWLAKALIELGQFEERAGRLDNARRLYQAILDHGLPADQIARGRLGGLSGR